MVRSVDSIQKDINSLNEATTALAADFERLYAGYLDVLSQAMKRQVVLAAYHLCTQVYPEAFLRLSVGQREKLQQAMRQLGQEAQVWLQQLMEPSPLPAVTDSPLGETEKGQDPEVTEENQSDLSPPADPLAEEDQAPGGEGLEESSGVADADDQTIPQPESSEEAGSDPAAASSSDLSQGTDGSETAKPSPRQLLKSMLMAAMAGEMAEVMGGRLFTGDSLTPTVLAKQHLVLEQKIRDVLQRISKQANQILRAAAVIPDLPEAVLDAALEAETGMIKGRSTPNLLNVLVAMSPELAVKFEEGDGFEENDGFEEGDEFEDDDEFEDNDRELLEVAIRETQDDQDADDSDDNDDPRAGVMTHLAAINLRLADIEFADVQASLWRSKLRTALGRLRKLGKRYQQAQRELAIAEAEQAWRAVWYDDSRR